MQSMSDLHGRLDRLEDTNLNTGLVIHRKSLSYPIRMLSRGYIDVVRVGLPEVREPFEKGSACWRKVGGIQWLYNLRVGPNMYPISRFLVQL